MTDTLKLVIDCDPGTDDAQAIMMTLVRPGVKLLAVTTVEGNAPVANTTRNALRILNLCQSKVPVYRGSGTSLLGEPTVGDGFHGKDGMGDIPGQYPPDDSLLEKEHAATALIRLAQENPGEINLVALGPLTNLALAIRLDPDFGKKLKHCYIMGGNISGKGNITQSAEFNFYCDPEAAMVVLNQLRCPITLAAVEVCLQFSFSWEWYDKFSNINTAKAKFIKDIDKAFVANCHRVGRDQKYPCWDQLAVAACLRPAVVKATQHVYATVETAGRLTRGQMVVDWGGQLARPHNVHLITDVDVAAYEGLLMDAVLK